MWDRGWAQMRVMWLARGALLSALLVTTSQTQTLSPGTKATPSLISEPPATPKPKPPPSKALVQLSETELAEGKALLSNLGYWFDTAAVGEDASLKHAVIAFQKVEGRMRTGVLSKDELQALRQAVRPKASDPTHSYIEIDLNRQVLFVVEASGQVQRILPVSTGSGGLFTEGERTRRAVTPTGKFKVQRKIAGWRKSKLGLLYYPSYIFDGVAIHGNPAVPPTPASHGCIRIPMFAAKAFFELAPIGTEVLIYGAKPTTLSAPGPCKEPLDKPKP